MGGKGLFLSLCLALSMGREMFGHPAGLDSVTGVWLYSW